MMANGKSYEFFDHTADIGIRAQAATLEELFTRMAQGLSELLVEDSQITPHLARTIHLDADSTESLLLAWLNELLFLFATERFIPAEYSLSLVTPTTLRATIRGDAFDLSRHTQGKEVKAITRHILEVRQEREIWYAQVIVDI